MVKCKVPTCTYDTEADIEKTSKVGEHLQRLGFHVGAVHPMQVPQPVAAQQPAPTNPRTKKIAYPKLEMKDGSSTEEQWNFFTFSWQQYKVMANIGGQEKERLGGCLGDTVVGMVFARHGNKRYKELTEEELVTEAKQLVVKSRNKLFHRLKLATMAQGGDESITSFQTRLKPVARTGKFQVECVACKGQADYTDHMVLDNLIRGLANEEGVGHHRDRVHAGQGLVVRGG